MDIGAVLYSIIEQIGKEKIQSDITSDIGLSRHYIELIMDECKKATGAEDDEATICSLCEALLHFMLTVCTLPSARKVQINNMALDIIIPNLRILKNSPNKSLVLQIVKKTNAINQAKIDDIKEFQPEARNLWLISMRPLLVPYLNYIVNFEENTVPSSKKRSFYDIIVDIQKFLDETGDKSLRLFQ